MLKEGSEQLNNEEEKTKEIAQRIYEQRMSGKGRKPKETIDKTLEAHGIKPWTPEAEEFMKKWDWEQAEESVKNHLQEKKQEQEEEKKADIADEKGKENKLDVFQIESLLGWARGAYIRGQQKYSQDVSSRASIKHIPEELKELKDKYNEAKISYVKIMRANKIAELEKSGISGNNLELELKKNQAEIFKRIIIDEQNFLLKEKVEGWPPKEKGIFRKGLDLWMRQGRSKRILISTALITGLSIATGGVAAAGIGSASLFAGSRFVKGFASAIMAQGIGRGVDWAFSKVFIDKVKEEAEEEEKREISEFYNGELTLKKIREIEEGRQQMMERLAKLERTKILVKGAAMIMTGVGASIGLGMLENTYAGSIKPIIPTEKPSSTLSLEDYYKIYGGKSPIEEGMEKSIAEISESNMESASESHINQLAELATIKKGEGAWHAVYRQLEERLHHNPSKFGLMPEDLQDATKIKNALNAQTGKILAEQGYIKADGTEIRISHPGVKVFLDNDNNIKLEDGGKLTGKWIPKSNIENKPPVLTPAPPENLPVESAPIEDAPVDEKIDLSKAELSIKPKEEFLINEPEPLSADKLPLEADQIIPPPKTFENAGTGIKGIFQYAPGGAVKEASIIGRTYSLAETSSLLNENWRSSLIEKGFSGGHANIIEMKASMLFKFQKMIQSLVKFNMEKSSEVDYLNRQIKEIIDSTEKMYGDVFK